MLQTRYSKEGMQHYLVAKWDREWLDTYDCNLLRYQEIPGFMSYEVREMNGETALYYKLDYRTSLETAALQISFNLDMVKNMITCILDAINVCEEYLLDSDYIVYEMDKIFIDITTGKLKFVYYPGEVNERHELKDLITQMFQYIDRKNEECMIYLMKFYDRLTKSENPLAIIKEFDIKTVDAVLPDDKEEELGVVSEEVNIKEEKSRVLDKINVDKIIRILMMLTAVFDITLLAGLIFDVLTYEKMGYLFIGMAVLIGLTILHIALGDEETPDEIMKDYYNNIEHNMANSYLSKGSIDTNSTNDTGSGETVILASEEDEKYNIVVETFHGDLYLEAMIKDRFPSIFIKNDNIVVGSYKAVCDYVLPERGVSRFHAKLMKREDGLFILDLNSTNGTYVNGELLEIGKEYRLEVGDMVSFAGNAFYVAEDTSHLPNRKAG